MRLCILILELKGLNKPPKRNEIQNLEKMSLKINFLTFSAPSSLYVSHVVACNESCNL